MTGLTAPTTRPFAAASPLLWLLDTNIVLDLWVFNDPLVQPLRGLLALPALPGLEDNDATNATGAADAADAAGAPSHAAAPPRWLATPAMREELARVLTYPHLVRRQALDARVATQVLAAYDRAITLCPVAPKARFTCTDGDDQKFIDLAAAHACPPPLTGLSAPATVALISKDKAVLRLKKRLATLGVTVARHWPAP